MIKFAPMILIYIYLFKLNKKKGVQVIANW